MVADAAKEKELGTADSHGIHSPASTTDANKASSTCDATKQKHLNNLRTFQDLVGIRTPAHILSSGSIPSKHLVDLEKASKLASGTPGDHDIQHSAGRPKRSLRDLIYRSEITNDGIYGRAIDEALKAGIGFNISNWFIHSLYVIQIFVAATITGLASYHGHEIPLTVLGAVNAVLAGLMALIKGQGLPNRLRRSTDQFQNVMKTIENRERMFARFAHMDPQKYGPLPLIPLPDPFDEYQKCQDLYDAAKRDQQANYPDLYSNTNELLAVQQINNNNRLGGLGIYGNAGSNDIQALSKTLQAQLAALTAKLDSTIKTDANALKGIKSDNTDNTNTVAVAGGTPGVTY